MSNRSPIVTTNVYPKIEILEVQDPIVLLIGQTKGSALNSAGKIVKDVKFNQVEDLFGNNSEVAWMIKRFREHNKKTRIDVLPLGPHSAGRGSGLQILFDVTPNDESFDNGGLIEIRPFDDEFKFKLPVRKGDTAAKLAERLKKLINTPENYYPFTAQNNDGATTINLDITGFATNNLSARVTGRVNGVTVKVLDSKAGEGSSPVLKLEEVVSERYHTIVFQEEIHIDEIVEFLEKRFNSRNAILSGVGVTVWTGKEEAETGLIALMKKKNSACLIAFANFEHHRSKYNCLPSLLGSEFAAKRSLRLTKDQDISHLVKNPELSGIGGPNRASLAYHQTPMSYLNCLTHSDANNSGINEIGHEQSLEELEALNEIGFSSLVDTPSGSAELGEMVTAYKKDSSGYPDTSLHYLEAVDCSIVTKEYFFNQYKQRLSQTNIIKGDPREGYDEVNELGLKAIIGGWYQDLIDMSILESSADSKSRFKNGLKIKIRNGKIAINAPFEITLQIRSIIMNLYLTLRG